MNAKSELPKLRDGVTYRNPEGVPHERIPEGYRLVTSVEKNIPDDGMTPHCKFEPKWTWGATCYGNTPLDGNTRSHNTYVTKEPLPAAALPVVEAQLPAGVRWLGKPLDQESLDSGWRRLCTADTTNPGDLEFLSWFGSGSWSRSTAPAGLPRTINCTPSEPFSYRTRAPLPKFPNPDYVSAEPEITSVRYTFPGVAVYYQNDVPIFPPLPAGVEWVNLCGLTPVDIGVAEGWRPLCTLDKAIPVDAETLKGTPKIWRPSSRRGECAVSRYIPYRTKNPIPELSWPELPAGESYFNPQNLTPADLGFGYRPLCTLDERYPAVVTAVMWSAALMW